MINKQALALGKRIFVNVEEVVASRLCQGCGACAYACKHEAVKLHDFIEIGIRPTIDGDMCNRCGDCVDVCSGVDLRRNRSSAPAAVIQSLASEWGPVLELWEGHATDEEIWFRGSSGGVATALAAYCLEKEGMSGVLHVGMDPELPYLNRTVMSRSTEELKERTGSRYAPAAVCADLGAIESSPTACVLIAKPCDVAAAQKARSIRPELDRNLGLTIAIFCGGTPSTRGTLEVLSQLGVEKSQVGDLRYRGHGWPGMTGVNLKTCDSGRRIEMTYQQAWDTILTKYKPFRCQVCPDGAGEFADISCGDPWYRPSEPGERGSTLIIVRSQRGRDLLHRALADNYIAAIEVPPSVLPASQLGLLNRRRNALPKLMWLRLMLLPYPRFRGMSLWRSWLKLPARRKWISVRRALSEALNIRRAGRLDPNKSSP